MVPQSWRKIGIVPAVIVFLLITTIIIRGYRLDFSVGGIQQDVSTIEQQASAGIPHKIWQIFSTPAHYDGPTPQKLSPDALGDARSWIALNPGYEYQLIGAQAADEFVLKHFIHDRAILDTYFALENPGMKTDLLRYLILSIEGGVYTDLDTWALKPIDAWVPEHLQHRISAVVGIEFDQLDGEPWPGFGDEPSYMTHHVQFCQWTLAAAPGHPIYDAMIRAAISNIHALALEQETTISNVEPTGYQVVTTTGPAAFTDVVFAELQKMDPTLGDLGELSDMKESRLIGDVLVLTINGFGAGQPHSHSTGDMEAPQVLVKHNFRHSWLLNVHKP